MCHLVYPVCVCTECHLEKPVFTPEDICDGMLRSHMECDTDDVSKRVGSQMLGRETRLLVPPLRP